MIVAAQEPEPESSLGELGEYCGLVGLYAGDVGEYPLRPGLYMGEVGE
jgi:hypothetical protein